MVLANPTAARFPKPTMHKLFGRLVELVLLTGSLSVFATDLPPLFNGVDFTGWKKVGGAVYEINDGVITGRDGDGSFGWLCTEKAYGDFFMELEVNIASGNSGIQIRSHLPDGKTMVGYQIEVDPSKRAWSGGLYEQARRNWLQNLTNNPEARAAFKVGEWNHYRIECRGDSIKSWVNGVPATDYHDAWDPDGIIALQVHAGTNVQVQFRNIRLQELPPVASTGQILFNGSNGIVLKQLGDRYRVEINGKLFTEYHFRGGAKPYCYPVLGPGEAAMTRKWPLEEEPEAEHDHPHHTGLFFGHQKVNGENFWTTNTGTKVEQQTIASIKSGTDWVALATFNNWISSKGEIVARDERTLRFYNRPNECVMDFEVTLKASEGAVTLGDDKDGMMAIRVPETMRALKFVPKGEKAKPGDGHIVLATGINDDGQSAVAAKDAKKEAQTWGKRAEWCDYYGPVAGKTVGIAIFDHPSNPRHPTWWHVRDYGLFAANPFGQHYFENLEDKDAGNFTVVRGKSATFRYRFFFHEGDEKQANVAGRYSEYVKESGETKDKP